MKWPLLKRFCQVSLLCAGFLACAALYLYTKDYTEYFRERKGTLVYQDIQNANGDSLSDKSYITLRSSTGLAVTCGMLAPKQKGKRYPAVVLIGGNAAGKHAIEYAVDVRDVVLVAPDYPYAFRKRYPLLQLIRDVPTIRLALLDMVPSVMLVIDYLWRRSDVDTTRLVLLGYSFGAPLVPPIHTRDGRAAVAVMVYGGGNLQSLITHNVRRYEGPVVGRCVGILGWILLRPLEPMECVDRVAPTPLIMINGLDDEQIPRENAEMLYNRAEQPKKIIWLESQHVRPTNVQLTRTIVQRLTEELLRRDILRPPL